MSGEKQIIDFGATEIMPGVVMNMQTIYMSWVTMFIVAFLLIVIMRNPRVVPGKMQVAVEAMFDFVIGLVSDNLGEKGKKIVGPFFITLFMYILVANEIGLLPQVFEPMHIHITSPTNDINTTLGLSLTVIITIYLVGIARNGIHFFKHFFEPSIVMFPLHVVEEFVKPLTLAFRLFGNILAGEILLIVLYQISPWVIPEVWVVFSLAVGVIQALIFTTLGICYMRGAFAAHH